MSKQTITVPLEVTKEGTGRRKSRQHLERGE